MPKTQINLILYRTFDRNDVVNTELLTCKKLTIRYKYPLIKR